MEESPPSTFSLSHSFKSTLKLVLYLSFMYIDVTEKNYTVTRARESCEYSLSYKIINTHFSTDVPLAWLPWWLSCSFSFVWLTLQWSDFPAHKVGFPPRLWWTGLQMSCRHICSAPLTRHDQSGSRGRLVQSGAVLQQPVEWSQNQKCIDCIFCL